MPLQQSVPEYEDYDFDPMLHASGTKGRAGECTLPGCDSHPVTSRRWQNPAYPEGWWGAYCQEHADRHAAQ
jgi:hypothetical protein